MVCFGRRKSGRGSRVRVAFQPCSRVLIRLSFPTSHTILENSPSLYDNYARKSRRLPRVASDNNLQGRERERMRETTTFKLSNGTRKSNPMRGDRTTRGHFLQRICLVDACMCVCVYALRSHVNFMAHLKLPRCCAVRSYQQPKIMAALSAIRNMCFLGRYKVCPTGCSLVMH